MDIQSFLESGLLESYALGQCTATERTLVEDMLAQHAEARSELSAIESALEQYANAQAIAPPPELKQRILQEIDRLGAPHAPGQAPTTGNRMLRGLQLLSVLLLASVIFLLSQQNKLKTQLGACDTRNDRSREIVEVIRNSATKAVKMNNDKDAPVFVFHNASTQYCKVLLDVSALPGQASGKYLQFWALVDGKPVEMGMVQLDVINGFQEFSCNAAAAGFAVSIEDNPTGNRTPTTVLMAGMAPPI